MQSGRWVQWNELAVDKMVASVSRALETEIADQTSLGKAGSMEVLYSREAKAIGF